jgi:glucose/arabinose dehydrogenase
MIYHGAPFAAWDGNLFVGGLSADHSRISRVTVRDGVVTGRVPMLMQQYRIRDVREGPDGLIYIATDSRSNMPTAIIRLEPQQ